MRVIGLFLVMIMIFTVSVCHADVSGKVLSYEKENSKTVRVISEYTYPDGTKKQGVTRYNYDSFTVEKVQADVKAHCETITKYYIDGNLSVIDDKKEDILDAKIAEQNSIIEGGVKQVTYSIKDLYLEDLDLTLETKNDVLEIYK